MEPRLNALLDLSSPGGMPYATNAPDATTSSSHRPPHQADSTFVRPKALMPANSSSPDNTQANDFRKEVHDKIHPTRAMPSAPIAQVLNNEANLLSSQSVPNTFAPSTTPFSGRLVDLLLESPEHTKQRWDQDQQFLQPDNTGYSPSVIKLPRLPQPPKKTAKRPRIPPLLQGLHQPPPLPPEGRLFPPITGEKNAFAGERGYDSLFEEPRGKDVDDHAFLDNSAQELVRSAQHGEYGPNSQATAQNAPLSGMPTVQEAKTQLNQEISPPSQTQTKRGKKRTKWSEQETKDLLIGVSRFGIGSWKKILQSPDFTFNNRTAVDLKDRFRVCCPGEGLKPRQPRASVKEKHSVDVVHTHPDSHGKSAEQVDKTNHSASASLDSTVATRTTKATATMPNLSELGIHEPFSKTARRPRRPFTATDDVNLLKGFEKYGPVWHSMRDDPELEFGSRHATDLRDRFRIRYPERYARAGYKLKSKEKERERMRRGIDMEIDTISAVEPPTSLTTSKDKNPDDPNTITLSKPTNTAPPLSYPPTNSISLTFSQPSLTSHLQYTTNATTTTGGPSLKPFTTSSSYLADPLPTLSFSDEEDITDDMAHNAHSGGGDQSPVTLSRNILRWADANPSSLYSFVPGAGYRAASGSIGGGGGAGERMMGFGGGSEGVGGSSSSGAAAAALGGGQQQAQLGQQQGDGMMMRNNILPEAEGWSFADRTASLASFKYRG
ncbi:hypothetical protein COCMIDRAFT_88979 [Bipolaris oryzae ATCC 44560]|uniref:Myb-like domain-containing protein n=1 Tax=Bipolaris oryzae ATCC 44560 TaxID=930090 RepID=W6ZDI6_COCMI|nr:uncharacterized protein COCMIDRAFT_88979 [Bipolaris oryzae ATCC 44560]EUC47908.1 hypothetical protein COCMIDRAFT_88979 [Bipolaris oryzae ATCC 44560]